MPGGAAGAVVAVDVGGTTVKGLVRVDGVVLDRATLPTFDGPHNLAFDAVIALVDRLAASASEAGSSLAGIGICTPGVVDSEAGRIVIAVNLGWQDLPIVDLLRERYGVPVAVAHDARAAAAAEVAARTAAGRPADEMVFVPIGTGVSASLVVDGRMLHGASGGAGEIGHVCVRPGGDQCTCGQRGCVEAYASASSIRRRYRAAGGVIEGGTEEIVNAIGLDPIATMVWDDAVDALAAGVAALAAILDPAVVVIGGGLAEAGERLLAPLRVAVDARLGWRSTPRIEQSLVGAGAGLAGAALLAENAIASDDPSLPVNQPRRNS